MVKTLAALLAALPTNAAPEDERKSFAVKVTTDFQLLYAQLPLLGFMDESLVGRVEDEVRSCEDILSEHAVALQAGTLPGSATSAEAWEAMKRALRIIREHHLSQVR